MSQNQGRHLSPRDISAYLADASTPAERAATEDHLCDCPECRQELIQASRAPSRHRPARWIAAAVPVLAAAVFAFLFFVPGSDPGPPPGSTSGNVLRDRGEEASQGFVLITPSQDQMVPAFDMVFIWGSAGTDASYQLTLAGQGGDIVWAERTQDTVLALPDSVLLTAGASYFWYVDALLPGARTSSTTVQQFSVER